MRQVVIFIALLSLLATTLLSMLAGLPIWYLGLMLIAFFLVVRLTGKSESIEGSAWSQYRKQPFGAAPWEDSML